MEYQELKRLFKNFHMRLTQRTEFAKSTIGKKCNALHKYNIKYKTSFYLHFKPLGESQLMYVDYVTTGGKNGQAIWNLENGFLLRKKQEKPIKRYTQLYLF